RCPMQKVLDFLEQHVQWVAIAIAALFLGYALYSYLPGLSQPVALELDGSRLTPGEVEPQIAAAAGELQDAMDRARAPRINVPDFVGEFNRLVNQDTRNTLKLPAFAVSHQRITYPPGWDPDAK